MQKLKHALQRWIGRPAQPAAVAAVPASQVKLPRSALIGRDGRIAGWVLHESATPHAPEDFARAAQYATALGRCSLLAAQAHIFDNASVLDVLPSGTILHVETLPATHAKTAKRLRSRGVRFATNTAADSDFAVLRELRSATRPAIVFPLPDSAACVTALNSGAHFVGGVFNDRALMLDASGEASGHAIARVLHELNGGASHERIAAQLSVDSGSANRGLQYRLLRLANAHDRSFTKGSDAVSRFLEQLPRDALTQTLWLLLVTADRSHRIAPALHELAIARARTMELLAAHVLPAADRHGAQLTGLCSMLAPAAVASLPLPADAQLALQHGRGPLIDLLNLSCALECADVPAIERLSRHYALPAANGLSLHAQAIDWAIETAALVADAE